MKKNNNRIIQYVIAYTVSLAGLSYGTFSTWVAPVLPKFKSKETGFEITDTDMSWMVAMASLGFVAGSIIVRLIADRIGRRITIISSALPFGVGAVLALFANQAWQLLVARFLWGAAGGMFTSVASLYLAELADKEIRGELITVTRTMFNVGSLLVMCIGPFVSYSTLNYTVLTLPVLHFIGCLWIPESPYFFLKERKPDEAKKVLRKIRSYENEQVLEDDITQLKADVRNEMRNSSSLKELFTAKIYRKAIIICLGLKSAQLLTGQLVLSQYLGIIMSESNTTMDIKIIFIIFGVVRCVTSVMSSLLSDRVGRRPLLLYSYFLVGIFNLIIGIYFFLKEVLKYDHETLQPYSSIPFVGLTLSNIVSTLGYYSVIYVVPAELFPLNVKALAMTCFGVYSGLLNFVVARGYQVLIDISGLYGVFWFFAAAGLFGAVFTQFYVPETKEKTLRQIQELLQGDLYVNDEVINLRTQNGDVEKDAREDEEL